MKKVNTRKMPIYRDAGFFLKSANETKKAFAEELAHPRDPGRYIYSRYRNPTVAATEEHIMQLEDSNWALLTQSGMAAIDMALSIFQKGSKKRNWLFFSDIYGGTNSFIDKILIKKRDLNIYRFHPDNGHYNLESLEKTIKELNPELLYFEVISNPMLIVADASEIIRLAGDADCRVIIDNTFSTPVLCKPLHLGADLVVHSATKYLSGHGNITAGVLCGNDEFLMQKAIEYRKLVGHMLSPDDAARLDDQLKTFEIRFQTQINNAEEIAEALRDHPMINMVLYPGLKNHATHSIAVSHFNGVGFGAMITFEIKGKDKTEQRVRLDAFIERVSDHFPLVPSLGDVETTVLPVEAVWGEKYPFPGMIRLSTGIEDTGYIKDILLNALDF